MNFSPAEQNVVTYLRKGYTNQQIADQFFICEKTVKFHLTSIYKKAGVKSAKELLQQDFNKQGDQIMTQLTKPQDQKPLEQGARAVQVVGKTQEDKITFIDEKFKVGESISYLHKMMKDVTSEEINPATVNAACNCVARLNETINTAIQAARFLNER